MKEDNETTTEETLSAEKTALPEKFKSVDALVRAYETLEAEFTRRSQRLKTLEEQSKSQETPTGDGQANANSERAIGDSDELYRAVMEREEVRSRVLTDYLNTLKGVPLMTGSGTGVSAPNLKPKTIREAGELALGYLKTKK